MTHYNQTPTSVSGPEASHPSPGTPSTLPQKYHTADVLVHSGTTHGGASFSTQMDQVGHAPGTHAQEDVDGDGWPQVPRAHPPTS